MKHRIELQQRLTSIALRIDPGAMVRDDFDNLAFIVSAPERADVSLRHDWVDDNDDAVVEREIRQRWKLD